MKFAETNTVVAALACLLVILGAAYGYLSGDLDQAGLTTLYSIPADDGAQAVRQYSPLGLAGLLSLAAAIAALLAGAYYVVATKLAGGVPKGLPWKWEAGLAPLKRELNRVDGVVAQFAASNTQHAASLTAANQLLAGQTSAPAVSAIVDGLLSENKRLHGECSTLMEQLGEKQVEKQNVETALEKVQQEQGKDALTGLGNRRTLDTELQAAIAGGGTPMSLVMVDIDHFKPINDTHGHTVGDEVIRALAGLITASLRKYDVATRYGGEEFAIIMPKANLEAAKSVAERIRKKWGSRKMTLRASGQVIGPMTASFGVAELRVGDTPDTLIGRADRKLYAAKSAGRNRVMG
jgi:diguanylate cyclase